MTVTISIVLAVLITGLVNFASWMATRGPTPFFYRSRTVPGRMIYCIYTVFGTAILIVYLVKGQSSFPAAFRFMNPVSSWAGLFLIWGCCYSVWCRHSPGLTNR
jgi:hypothetical protein